MPKASVILSSYNHAGYVAEAIESVLNQTFQDFELLIFDDGSKDGSADVIRSFRDPRITTFLYEENKGPLEAAKEAFAAARGEYLAIHHSDDVWELDKLEKQVRFLDEHREVTACFSHAFFIDAKSRKYELREGNPHKEVFQKENRNGAEWLNYFFSNPNCFCHPSLLIRREAYGRYQMMPPEGLRQFPDFYMWLRLLAGGGEIYIYPEPLVGFRLRQSAADANVSAESMDTLVRCSYECIYLARVYGTIPAERFCQAFPDYRKYVVGDDIRLALGKLCLTSWMPAFRFYGLELLAAVLRDNHGEFSYGLRDFWQDSGRTDCFSRLRFDDIHVARMSIFYDSGDGYHAEKSVCRECYIHTDKTFSAFFEVDVPQGTRALRFDPEEGAAVRVSLTDFLVNGDRMEPHSNGIRDEDGFTMFYHGDPAYEVTGTFSGRLNIQIAGEMEYPHEAAVIEKQYHQMEAMKEDAESRIAELGHRLEEKERELEQMRQTKSWRYTQPLRDAGRMVRRWRR